MFCLDGTYSHLRSEKITRTGRICAVVTPKLLQVQPSGPKALRDDQAKYLKGLVDESTTFKLMYVSPHVNMYGFVFRIRV